MLQKIEKTIVLAALALVLYMPLHVFIAQYGSQLTGGIDAWKAAKDAVLVILLPILVMCVYKRQLHREKLFKQLLTVGGLYAALHTLFVVFDRDDHTFSALAGSVFNLRILVYLLLGYILGATSKARVYMKWVFTAAVIVASVVAVFAVLQYIVLPYDFLELFGYAKERGVPAMFFIDDDPNLPRVMGTLKDPNSLGAYLILPLLATGWASVNSKANNTLFIRPFRRSVLIVAAMSMFFALLFTFSRGALISAAAASIALFALINQKQLMTILRKGGVAIIIALVALGVVGYAQRDSAFVQDYVLHAAESDSVQDPNELRVSLQSEAIDRIADEPLGHGPGSAGLVSISNPQGGFLTENYYLQIAYEVGWLGLALFIGTLYVIAKQLYTAATKMQSPYAKILLASLVGYALHSLLIHLWSNEAVALQWWLLAGAVVGSVSVVVSESSQ